MKANATTAAIDWSGCGRARIWALTSLGTLACIAVAFMIDGFDAAKGQWRWGSDPINNLVIPLLIAPPLFFFLLDKMQKLAVAHHELLIVATTDSLTSLLNRRAFTDIVEGYLNQVAEAQRPIGGALLVIDVDHFKAVNDSCGHDTGDEALKLIAKTIRAAVRDTDLVGRLGGEEFCVFLPGSPWDNATVLAERIRSAVAEAVFMHGGSRHELSISVGGVGFDQAYPFSDLYRTADQLLYAAKRNGRNRVEFWHKDVSVLQPAIN